MERLQNLGSTLDVEACRCIVKTPNAINGPSSLPVMVAQPDKKLRTGLLGVGVV